VFAMNEHKRQFRHSLPSKPGLIFVVQKHQGRNLHYDFRLEANGVLKSWAVPKGPSLDPAVKRLAVVVEDHPLEYADFEGNIPEGQYGAGPVMVWDRGTYTPEYSNNVAASIENGELKFVLHGQKLRGSWVLVRTPNNNWLLIKHRDAYASSEDITRLKPRSVLSGRSLSEIARMTSRGGRDVSNNRSFAKRESPGPDLARVGGIAITHPDKLWFPEDQITKLEVARYYATIAPRIVPWLNQRLLTAERCPDGIAGACFFEKNFSENLPAGIPTRAVPAESAGKNVHYVVGGSKETLLTLVNLGCIAIHVMNCQVDSLDLPDWLAFDLDPSTGQFRDAAKAAGLLRELLNELRIRSFPKTSGGRGLHVLVPLRRGLNQEQVRLFAHNISQEMASRSPATITVEMRKANRQNRVFADWLRNAFGQTIVAPYSIRCRPGAPVSTPLDWEEVRPELNPSRFNIRTIQRRMEGNDPWADFWRSRQALAKSSKAFTVAES